jgi:hypothetical protein
VSEKNRKIDDPYAALPFERYGTDLVMVKQIRSQKKNRARERSQHASFVRVDVSRLDKKISTDQEHGAERVQRGIERRQL